MGTRDPPAGLGWMNMVSGRTVSSNSEAIPLEEKTEITSEWHLRLALAKKVYHPLIVSNAHCITK